MYGLWSVKTSIFTASLDKVYIFGMSAIWTYDNLLVDFVVWLFIGAITCWITMNLYYVCFGYRGRANRGVINAMLSRNLCILNLPPQLAYMAGGRFQEFRVQLSVLNRELQLDSHLIEVSEIPDIHPPTGPAMTAEDINALPVSKYRPINQNDESTAEEGSSSSASEKGLAMVCEKCIICLDILNDGDLVRTLPCYHEFHAGCVDPWLKRLAMCPVCKIPTTSEFGTGGRIFPFDNNDHEMV